MRDWRNFATALPNKKPPAGRGRLEFKGEDFAYLVG